MVSVASSLTSGALMADAVATFVKPGVLLQCGDALAVMTTLTVEPGGMFGTFTLSGFVDTIVHETAMLFDDTLTLMPVSHDGSAGSSITTPVALADPVLETTIVYVTPVVWFTGTLVGDTTFVMARDVCGTKPH